MIEWMKIKDQGERERDEEEGAGAVNHLMSSNSHARGCPQNKHILYIRPKGK